MTPLARRHIRPTHPAYRRHPAVMVAYAAVLAGGAICFEGCSFVYYAAIPPEQIAAPKMTQPACFMGCTSTESVTQQQGAKVGAATGLSITKPLTETVTTTTTDSHDGGAK